VTLLLSNLGLANVREESGTGGAALSVVGTGFAKAKSAIDSSAEMPDPRSVTPKREVEIFQINATQNIAHC